MLAVMQKRHPTNMKIPAFLISLILTQACLAQFKVTQLDKNSIPKTIHYNGDLVEAFRWTDKSGVNIVILSDAGPTPSKNAPDDGYNDQALYAYHYLVSGDSSRMTWKIYDYLKECDLDIDLYFVDKSFAITDINHDGKAEVWIMYKNSCHGDVSPVPMKIIMYQDGKKFAVRGTTKVQVSGTDYMGGEFSFDDAFKKGPAEFRHYAEKLWKEHKVETWKQ
jgi:hypothetical protein